MAKKNLYIDMDGTVATWEDAGIDEVASPGYFRNRKTMDNVIAALEKLQKHFNLVILSAVFKDNHSVKDKKFWLRMKMPFIDIDNAIFVPYGSSKYEFLIKELKKRGKQIEKNDMFIDDYTKNLVDMKVSSKGKVIPIKVLNGINDTNKSWDGYRLSSASSPEIIANTILAISQFAE